MGKKNCRRNAPRGIKSSSPSKSMECSMKSIVSGRGFSIYKKRK